MLRLLLLLFLMFRIYISCAFLCIKRLTDSNVERVSIFQAYSAFIVVVVVIVVVTNDERRRMNADD
jgi:hypothetical protein